MPPPSSEPGTAWTIEVFYDGACSLCTRDIPFLQRLDRKHRIRYADISAEDFDAGEYGHSFESFMSEIHGRLPDGTWVRGVEVSRRLYASVGLGPIVSATRLPGLAGLLDRAYRIFARNRLRWTGRCAEGKNSCGGNSCSTVDSFSGHEVEHREGSAGDLS
jgi:predicted DCC family thiol-disulfide oxidoreductase YuxK